MKMANSCLLFSANASNKRLDRQKSSRRSSCQRFFLRGEGGYVLPLNKG